MADVPDRQALAGVSPGRGLIERLLTSRRFHAFAARTPFLRRIVRREGEAIFQLVQGFVQSQALMALVELRIFDALHHGPRTVLDLAHMAQLPPERMQILLQAGAAMRLLKRQRDGRFSLSHRGLAFGAVPGLAAMVRHHSVLYRDLAEPVAFLRGQTDPGLSGFWPYVFGAAAAEDPGVAATYSTLMADSQVLVAEDTLHLVDFRGIRHLMDVGGGTGAFLAAVGQAHPSLRLSLLDLPVVLGAAGARLGGRVTLCAGSFRDGPLPKGADAISLIRVLYDHADETVVALLSSALNALPAGGRIVISEPMSGGTSPDVITDVYFAFYTLAMQTGRTRSGIEIAALLAGVGFVDIHHKSGPRPFVTSVVTARKPGVALTAPPLAKRAAEETLT